MKHLRVTVLGKVYDVTVETLDEGAKHTSTPQASLSVTSGSATPVPTPSTPAPGATSGGPGEVLSPLSGKVMDIQVVAGQDVKQGDILVVLEAMKMNTYIYSPQDGKVAEILVSVGDGVVEGQPVLKVSQG